MKLTLENFQAHRFREIELDPHVTTIVGPTDSGKSAVMRALIWLMTNRPVGDEFIRDGADTATVTLEFDGHVVRRIRGKAGNLYQLDEREFKAFGNDVPDEIAQLVNVGEMNIQRQHDSPWWFNETAGEVSRQLNAIVDLSVIDRSLSKLDQAHREVQTEIRVLERQQEEAKVHQDSFKWAARADKALKVLEEGHRIWQEATREAQGVAQYLSAVRESRQEVETLTQAHTAVSGLVQQLESVQDLEQRCGKLNQLIESAEEAAAQVKVKVPDISPLMELEKTLSSLESRSTQLRNLIESSQKAEKEKRELLQSAETAHAEFREQLGKVCPLCDSKL